MGADAPVRQARPPGRPPPAVLERATSLIPAATLAAGLAVVVVGSVWVASYAASGANLGRTLGAIGGLAGLGLAAAMGRLRAAVFGALVVTSFVVPDILVNIGLGSAIVGIVGLLAVVSLPELARRVHQVTILDAAVALLFVTGAVLPAIVSGTPTTIVGNGALILGTYVVARTSAPDWDRLVTILLAIGALHGIVSILWAIPATSSLIPFVPLQAGLPNPSSRATALFNNPNTFGVVEAMIVVLAFWNGVGRRGALAIVLCVAGILLSGSREALVGLVIGCSVVVIRSPRRALGPAGALGIAVGVVLALVPTVQRRFDPSGFAEDSSLLERFELWDEAIEAFLRSPIIGYGQTSGLRAVDQAYLNWLVDGGLIGASLWLAAIVMIGLSFSARPVLVVMLVVGLLGNPFAGPALALLLVLLGASHLRSPTDAGGQRGW